MIMILFFFIGLPQQMPIDISINSTISQSFIQLELINSNTSNLSNIYITSTYITFTTIYPVVLYNQNVSIYITQAKFLTFINASIIFSQSSLFSLIVISNMEKLVFFNFELSIFKSSKWNYLDPDINSSYPLQEYICFIINYNDTNNNYGNLNILSMENCIINSVRLVQNYFNKPVILLKLGVMINIVFQNMQINGSPLNLKGQFNALRWLIQNIRVENFILKEYTFFMFFYDYFVQNVVFENSQFFSGRIILDYSLGKGILQNIQIINLLITIRYFVQILFWFQIPTYDKVMKNINIYNISCNQKFVFFQFQLYLDNGDSPYLTSTGNCSIAFVNINIFNISYSGLVSDILFFSSISIMWPRMYFCKQVEIWNVNLYDVQLATVINNDFLVMKFKRLTFKNYKQQLGSYVHFLAMTNLINSLQFEDCIFKNVSLQQPLVVITQEKVPLNHSKSIIFINVQFIKMIVYKSLLYLRQNTQYSNYQIIFNNIYLININSLTYPLVLLQSTGSILIFNYISLINSTQYNLFSFFQISIIKIFIIHFYTINNNHLNTQQILGSLFLFDTFFIFIKDLCLIKFTAYQAIQFNLHSSISIFYFHFFISKVKLKNFYSLNQGKEKESSGILFKIQKIEMNKNNNYFNFFASNIIIEQTYSDGYCLGYLSGNKYLFGQIAIEFLHLRLSNQTELEQFYIYLEHANNIQLKFKISNSIFNYLNLNQSIFNVEGIYLELINIIIQYCENTSVGKLIKCQVLIQNMTIKNNKNMQMNVGFLRGMLSKMKLINLTLLSGIVNGMELNECDVMMLKCYVDMNVLKIVNSVVIVVKVKINLELSYGDIIIFGSRILIGQCDIRTSNVFKLIMAEQSDIVLYKNLMLIEDLTSQNILTKIYSSNIAIFNLILIVNISFDLVISLTNSTFSISQAHIHIIQSIQNFISSSLSSLNINSAFISNQANLFIHSSSSNIQIINNLIYSNIPSLFIQFLSIHYQLLTLSANYFHHPNSLINISLYSDIHAIISHNYFISNRNSILIYSYSILNFPLIISNNYFINSTHFLQFYSNILNPFYLTNNIQLKTNQQIPLQSNNLNSLPIYFKIIILSPLQNLQLSQIHLPSINSVFSFFHIQPFETFSFIIQTIDIFQNIILNFTYSLPYAHINLQRTSIKQQFQFFDFFDLIQLCLSSILNQILYCTLQNFQIKINIYFNDCSNGFYYSTIKYQCIACGNGYFTDGLNWKICYPCDNKVVCRNSQLVGLNNGFWRSFVVNNQKKMYSENILMCQEQVNCEDFVLMNKKVIKNENGCLKGYTGILCQSCKYEQFYYRSGYQCQLCENSGIQSVFFGMAILSTSLMILFSHKSQQESNQKIQMCKYLKRCDILYFLRSQLEQKQGSVLLYQLNNYNILFIFISNQLNNFIIQILNSICSIQSNSNLIAYSSECFILSIRSQYFIYLRLIATTLFLPISIILVSTFLFTIFKFYLHLNQHFTYYNFIIHLLFAFQIYQIDILQKFSFYTTFENNQYILQDIQFQAFTYIHKQFLLFLIFPLFLIWTIVLPFYAFYQITNHQTNSQFHYKFGFLYNLFSKKGYFHLLFMQFMIFMIQIQTNLNEGRDQLQIQGILFILMLIMFEQALYSPYDLLINGKLEKWCIESLFLFYLLGAYINKLNNKLILQNLLKQLIIIINFILNTSYIYQIIKWYLRRLILIYWSKLLQVHFRNPLILWIKTMNLIKYIYKNLSTNLK